MPDEHNDQKAPKKVDFILIPKWIVPVVPRDRVLQGCGLAIDDGKIVSIDLAKTLKKNYQAERLIELPESVVIPGLVNAHGHAAMSLMRGYADDKALMDWLENHIWPAESTWVNESFVADGSRLAMAEMLLSGTTCFSDMYFYPEATASVAKETGMRCQLAFPVLDFPTAWAQDADEYLRKGIALHDQYKAHPLINVTFGPHAPYTVSDAPLKKVATYAEELQSPIQIHLHETEHEVASSIEQHGKRPIERLNELGVLSPLTQCVHMTQIEDTDMTLLAESGAHVVHCPSSNLKLASGFCPTAALIEAGVNVCLGTDGAASNNDLDLFSEMKIAAMLAKAVSGDASAVNAMTALEMATINGAKALGLDKHIGSLEVGKSADMVAIDLANIPQKPLYNPISQLVYTNIAPAVSHTWVNGKLLVEDRRLLTINEDAVLKTTEHWQNQLASD